MSALTVGGLRKGYAATPVLRDLDLQAPAGALTAVLGLSGCGKTTLLRVIAGFERPERGLVSLGDRTLEDAGATYVAPERREIGYVPQEGALFPHLNVRENVGFGLSRRERRGQTVDGLLEMVGIAALAKRLPHELSGGEQQRVALARALARRPQALLLDEPFSSLDASMRTRVREDVHELLRQQGVTTVLVTHDQEEALSLADVVAVLRDGRVVQQAPPAELYERPLDESLARFLGAVNVLDAQLRDDTAVTSLGVLALHAPAAGAAPAAGVAGVSGAVMVRPEQLEVHPLQAGEPGQGEHGQGEHEGVRGREGVRGHVEQCRYYGHDALLHIRTDDDPGAELLLARVPGGRALAVGTPVSVTVSGAAAALE
ncbi:MAG TPA: ABC transporter ATP-binding protein [Solirubrobacteraceae bacterium]|jgi:iron(III) transport system ATP-binding protein|nr:ABC transporter ATP-binding protein [Solirubrobacteraceae bacterium]